MDLARALAVLGMFTVHLGVGSIGLLDGAAAETLYELTRGRSSALFAFLAGVSLSLMSGRGAPLSGAPLRGVRSRVVVRSVVLAVVGAFLDLLGAPIAIILVYYAGYFLLALPLLRLGAAPLAGIAAAVAVLGPQVSYLVRPLIGDPQTPAASITSIGDFFLSGYYPACTFMAFVVAGMAVGRLDLGSALTRVRIAGAGLVLAVAGYGGSWLLMYPLGGIDRLTEMLLVRYYGISPESFSSEGLLAFREVAAEEIGTLHGNVPTDSPSWLLVASPHSGTTFEIAGATGVALVAVASCLFLADLLRWGVFSLAATGTMALTVYVGHIAVIAALGASPRDAAPFRLEFFVLGALLFASLWKSLLGRGPLERFLGWCAEVVSPVLLRSS